MIPLHEYENIRAPLAARIRELEEQLRAANAKRIRLERDLGMCRASLDLAATERDNAIEQLEAAHARIAQLEQSWHDSASMATYTQSVSSPASEPSDG